jgi:hypothetical protein
MLCCHSLQKHENAFRTKAGRRSGCVSSKKFRLLSLENIIIKVAAVCEHVSMRRRMYEVGLLSRRPFLKIEIVTRNSG